MSGSFALDLSAFSKKASLRTDQILRKVVLDMTAEIVELTPVKTGMAKNNYFWGLSRVDSVESEPNTGGAASLERAADFAATAHGGGVFYLTNNLPYIMPLEFGHSTQAPAGMARITVARWQQLVNAAAGAL